MKTLFAGHLQPKIQKPTRRIIIIKKNHPSFISKFVCFLATCWVQEKKTIRLFVLNEEIMFDRAS